MPLNKKESILFRTHPLGEYPKELTPERGLVIYRPLSGILTGISTYSFVKGTKNRRKYIELSGSPTSLSLNVTF